MNRWLALIPLAVLVALTVLFVGWSLKRAPAYKPDAAVGRQMPATILPVLAEEGRPPELRDLSSVGAGRPVIVNLFASWCAPCIAEHPRLMALKAQGVTLIGVAYKDDPAATRAMLAERGNPFAVILVDQDGQAGLDLGVSGVPESFAVDPSGRIAAKSAGPMMSDAETARMVAAMGR